MKKILTYSLLILLILALSLSVYFLLKEEAPVVQEENTDESITVKVVEPEITEIFLDNTEGSFHFIKRDGAWKIVFDEEMDAYGNTIMAIESILKVTLAEDLIEENASSMGKYGLDNPYSRVRYVAEDGTSGFLHLGNSVVSTKNYFTVDNKNVYTMPSNEAVFTFLGIGSFVDLSIAQYSIESISAVEIRNGKEEIRVQQKEVPETDDGNTNSLFSFELTKPVRANASPGSVEKLFKSFSDISAVDYLPYAVDEECGISADGMYFGIYGNGLSEVVYIGDTRDEEQTYVKKKGIKGVFLVDSSALSFMDNTTFVLVDKHIALYYFDKVKSIEITCPEGTYTMLCDGEYSVNGQKIEYEAAQDFFQALISLTYDDAVKDGESVGNEVISVKINTQDETDRISYMEYDAMSYAVSKKGVDGFTIQKKYVDRIINLIKGLL